ncbi:MAG: hypothetical protein LC107_00810 [Chitinophagales bacterium]|nr:hypothetical protein [Chitinophagales bacterium]
MTIPNNNISEEFFEMMIIKKKMEEDAANQEVPKSNRNTSSVKSQTTSQNTWSLKLWRIIKKMFRQ